MPQAFYCKDRQQLNLKHTSIKLFQQLSKPRISNRNSTDKASWGSGQHREFQTEILQTKQVGVRGQHREFQTEILQTRQVGVRSMFRQRAYNLCPTETIYKNSICKQN